MNTPKGAIERTVPVTFWPTCRLLKSSSRFSRRSSYSATFSDRMSRIRFAVDLEDLEAKLPAHERLELLCDLLGGVARLVVLRSAREVDDLADRHEAADAAVDESPPSLLVDDRRLDDHAGLELLLHRTPLALETGSSQRRTAWPSGDSGCRT